MTRINLVPPSSLTNKHLMAEYRELPRVFTAVEKLTYTPSPRIGDGWRNFMESDRISENYVLGKGHVIFFYNKLPFLLARYRDIAWALRTERNYTLDKDKFASIIIKATRLIATTALDQLTDWEPSPEEIYLNMARICKRSKIDTVLDELSAD